MNSENANLDSSFFRSELMSLIQLYIPSEVAQPTVSELGEMGIIQFRDLNGDVNAFQRAFVNEIRRLEEMDRKIRFLSAQMEKEGVPVEQPTILPVTHASHARTAREIDELEERLTLHESRVLQMNSSYATLQKRYLELAELRHVLRETAGFFQAARDHEDDIRHSTEELNSPLLETDLETGTSMDAGRRSANMNIGFVAGVINRARITTFERILWRALRGNLYMNYAEIDEPITDPITDEVTEKNVFIIFAHGKELLAKIKKISESLGASLYPIDANADRRRETMFEVTARIEDLNNVLQNTKQTRRAELLKVSESLTVWSTTVKKEKAIYYAMNLFNFDPNRKCLIAEGWCPTSSLSDIQRALRHVTEQSGSNVSSILHELRTSKEPPTYHRTNKVTKGFQAIVDSYGVARYREVNPGLFTVITFPFLFAVMFGDVGHGALVAMFAGFMIWKEVSLARKDYGEIFASFFAGRYIIFLMGLFSIYTGWLYNDIFSRALYMGDSGWTYAVPKAEGEIVVAKQTGVYAFGVDPAWHLAENALIFTNSYKMKMAIIFGVIQMTSGICLNVFNHIYFKHKKYIWCEFVPQVVFMTSIFGYLIICIIYKWSVDWTQRGQTPPSLLNMLIYMFLSPGTIQPNDELYPGQGGVQAALLLIAVICVPWMLLAKPFLLKREHSAIHEAGYSGVLEAEGMGANVRISTEGSEIGGAVVHEEMTLEEHFDFSEVMVHQSIHTIEFCLGCISNTASYLRLWALSLAHAQLSEVLWHMILHSVFGFTGAMGVIGIYVGFYFWFSLTLFILLLMEGLSAFLHALRLHWVEFNGKFYEGTGTMFMPFSFHAILNPDDD